MDQIMTPFQHLDACRSAYYRTTTRTQRILATLFVLALPLAPIAYVAYLIHHISTK
jgi:hypothetical protein